MQERVLEFLDIKDSYFIVPDQNRDRLVCYFSYAKDLGNRWEDQRIYNDPENLRQLALQMEENIISFAFTDFLMFNNPTKMKFRFPFILFIILSVNGFGQNTSYDEAIGKKGALQVISHMGIYEDSVKTAYIEKLGQNLVNKLDSKLFTYNFQIVDQSDPNAFALPAGHIYVTRGLLVLANNEDQLAGVIGHEIIHSQMRHTVKQMRKSIWPSLLQLPGDIAGVFSPVLAKALSPLTASSKAIIASHSRGHEKEADQYGVDIAAKAGYKPTELATILANLSKEVELLTGESERKNWLSDHPYTPKRLAYINKESKKVDVSEDAPISKSNREFLEKLDGLVFGQNPKQGVFQDNKFLHPELNITLNFPKNWTYINNPTAVGAIDSTKSAVIYLSGERKYGSAKAAADSIAYSYQKAKGSPVDEHKQVTINGLNGQLISIVDRSGSEPLPISLIWLELDGQILRIVFAGLNKFTDPLNKSAYSIRNITEAEKSSIQFKSVRIVDAQANESIEALSKRTSNLWNTELTAIINGMESGTILEKGQPIKIAVLKNYVKK